MDVYENRNQLKFGVPARVKDIRRNLRQYGVLFRRNLRQYGVLFRRNLRQDVRLYIYHCYIGPAIWHAMVMELV